MKRKSSAPIVSQQKKRRRKEAEEKSKAKKELFRKHYLKSLKKQAYECVSAIFQLTQEQLENQNNLLAEEIKPIFLQVTCLRIPQVPRRQLRILLPYSLVTPNDEVALFVCDLEKGRRKDYEPTVEHYRNLLNKHGCTRVNEIIPMNRVKTEFDQYELKRKLLGSYDHFLVDGRIAGHMTHLLGKYFVKKRKLPTSIRMQSKDLKHEIDYALRKTSMHLHSHGDTHLVQIGNTLMNKKEIVKNIVATCESLSKNYPGGWKNIEAVRLKTPTSLALPLYVSLNKRDKVAPHPIVVQPKRPKAYRDVEGELSTFTDDVKVRVKPDGEVILIKHKKKIGKQETARIKVEN